MKLQTLLVPVDFSLGSETAFRYAKFLARYVEKIAELNGEPEDEVSEKLCSLANMKLDSFLTHNNPDGLIAGKKLRVGAPFQAIAQRAQTIDADMIVMGGQGRAGNGEIDEIFFGSAAERVVRLLPCPVLCVPQEIAGLEDEPK